MGMSRLQEAYQCLVNDYDDVTKILAEQVHTLYVSGLSGVSVLQLIDELNPAQKCDENAREMMITFVDLVKHAISNQ